MVGTLAKFPNRHLLWSKPYFLIANLWATIEILISTQLSFKSILSNILIIKHWLLKQWHFGKFHHWPWFIHQIMSHVWSNGKFLIFLFLFGSLAIKAMAFWEISPLALLHASSYISCMVKRKISNKIILLFGTLAVKAMAFWEILLSSHQNLPFCKHVKISLIF